MLPFENVVIAYCNYYLIMTVVHFCVMPIIGSPPLVAFQVLVAAVVPGCGTSYQVSGTMRFGTSYYVPVPRTTVWCLVPCFGTRYLAVWYLVPGSTVPRIRRCDTLYQAAWYLVPCFGTSYLGVVPPT